MRLLSHQVTLLRLEFRRDSMAAPLSKLNCSRITKPWGLCKIMSVCGYKLLNFGGIFLCNDEELIQLSKIPDIHRHFFLIESRT